ncbi:uncharacterized protein LOC132733103 [Ruditapes philippinarum]|uniref:uncharacterized protein LOC132733103 n=1 Tax=Ruditapes philippinarum TaxID=129788 RepID=UPI00295AC93F|nr:uncharacterized protein LOC132733103 [Ruditapes philippinarum]
MAKGFILSSTVSLLLLWIASGSIVKDDNLVGEKNSPLNYTISKKVLADLTEKCRLFREKQRNHSRKLFTDEENRIFEDGCFEIDNLIKVNLTTDNGLFIREMVALKLIDVDKVKALQDHEITSVKTFPAKNRKRRTAFEWTCSQIRSSPMLFLTATEAEISAMSTAEFIDCIPDIGKLTDLKSNQRDALLSKAKTALSKVNVCDMDTIDLVNLGVVALSFSETDLSCLPLADNGLVTSLGILREWNSTELSALATRYMGVKSLSNLATVTSEDITMLGSILCGFTASQLGTLPAAEIGKSGAHIGELKECAIDQLSQLVKLATHVDAYGPVSTLEASAIEELGYLIAGLSGIQIKELSFEAIEGLDSDVIPVIPKDVLKEMTNDQIKSFTDDQATSVTDDQKAAMTEEQKQYLEGQATGGEEALEEVVNKDVGDSSATGLFTQMSGRLIVALLLVLLI